MDTTHHLKGCPCQKILFSFDRIQCLLSRIRKISPCRCANSWFQCRVREVLQPLTGIWTDQSIETSTGSSSVPSSQPALTVVSYFHSLENKEMKTIVSLLFNAISSSMAAHRSLSNLTGSMSLTCHRECTSCIALESNRSYLVRGGQLRKHGLSTLCGSSCGEHTHLKNSRAPDQETYGAVQVNTHDGLCTEPVPVCVSVVQYVLWVSN